MGRQILFFICMILLISTASANIILGQTKSLYNLGDEFSVQSTVKTTEKVTDFFQMYLLCDSRQTEFYREYLILDIGEEAKSEPSIVLYRNIVGDSSGICRIKATFKGEYVLSDDFKISSKLKINASLEKLEYSPEKDIIFSGNAVKENGELVNGFIDITIPRPNTTEVEILDTINDGLIFINFSMPKDAKSTLYLMTVKIYERDIYGEVTNNGIENYAYFISQIPTALEIEFQNSSEVIPGTSLKARAILKDQANDKINTKANIIVKDGDRIVISEDIQTGEFFELPVDYNQAPAKWIISASSEGINSERMFTIIEKEDVKTELVNNTIVLTNMGNVPYNKTVSVKINNQTLNFGTYLKVDESKTYIMTAPNGEYQVEVFSGGKSMFTGNTILTGKEIQVKEKTGAIDFIRHPLLWLFIIVIIGAVVFMFMRKNNEFSTSSSSSFSRPKKSEVMIRPRTEESDSRPSQPVQRRTIPVSENSYQPSQFQRSRVITEPEKEEIIKQPRKINPQSISDNFVIDSKIREAVPSSSISGPKQESSIICLKIKNSSAMNDSGVKENLQKIIRMAEDKRAVLYNNGEYLFFILLPAITRTQENEKTALNIAKSIMETMENHNKFFRQKLDYGISINNGEIVASKERDILKFMGLGNTILLAKKIASIAQNSILLGEAINFRLMSALKTEKRNQDGVSFYSIREMKQQPSEENQKFINGFVKRYRENRY